MADIWTTAGNRIEITEADLSEATRFIDEVYGPTVCPVYLANHRASLIREAAVAEMQKRQAREYRERELLEGAGLPEGEAAQIARAA